MSLPAPLVWSIRSTSTSISTLSPPPSTLSSTPLFKIPSYSSFRVSGIRRPLCKAVVGVEPEAATPTSASAAATSPGTKNKYAIENLTTWLLKQEQSGAIDTELTIVLSSISLACKQIASLLQRSSIVNLTGAHGTINIQGEDQKKLDVISNELFCSCLRSSGHTGIIASEEEDVPIAVEETVSGNYIVVFDPIDGSANIDTALTTGSIFGIYGPEERILLDTTSDDSLLLDEAEQQCIVDVCQPGSNLLAAGYCLYSSSTVFTLTLGSGVFGFTLDTSYGEFVLTHEDIKIPKAGNIYSFNEGKYDLWDRNLKAYIEHLRDTKSYSGRYIGCLVGEVHRLLLRGGIYGNPKNNNAGNGNLRLLYECAPMSFLVEQAGGKAIDGHQRILDIKPKQIHQRTPIFIGSPDEVFIPSVQIKKRLKNGTISVKPKSLFPGCVFLRCIMNKEVHDFIRECVGVGGFVGATVGNTKRQINKPRPVDDEDMEVIFRKVKEEQEIAEQAFLEENKGDGTLDPETSGFKDSQANSVGGDEHGSLLKPNGRARKAKTSAASKDIKVILRPGSPVRIVSGAFAGFSGVLKKAHLKKKMVTVAFTLFGKETIADLDVSEVVPDTS